MTSLQILVFLAVYAIPSKETGRIWRNMLTLLVAAFAAAGDCLSAVLNSQQDADKLQACETFNGTIQIGRGASGALTIPHFKDNRARVNITNELCESCDPKAASIDKLTVEGDKDHEFYSVVLDALAQLKDLDLGGTETASNVVLRNLPALASVKGSIFSVFNFELRSLPKLREFQLTRELHTGGYGPDYNNLDHSIFEGGAQIHDVGLESLDFTLPYEHVGHEVSVSGIPNVKNLTLNFSMGSRVIIKGHDGMSVLVTSANPSPHAWLGPRLLELWSVDDLRFHISYFAPRNVTFVLRNSKVKTLSAYFMVVDLVLQDNAELRAIETFSMDTVGSLNVVATNNSRLPFSSDGLGWSHPNNSAILQGAVPKDYL